MAHEHTSSRSSAHQPISTLSGRRPHQPQAGLPPTHVISLQKTLAPTSSALHRPSLPAPAWLPRLLPLVLEVCSPVAAPRCRQAPASGRLHVQSTAHATFASPWGSHRGGRRPSTCLVPGWLAQRHSCLRGLHPPKLSLQIFSLLSGPHRHRHWLSPWPGEWWQQPAPGPSAPPGSSAPIFPEGVGEGAVSTISQGPEAPTAPAPVHEPPL